MSGPHRVMDYRSPPRLKLLNVLLLVTICITCLQGDHIEGVDHHCVNDYLFTVRCSLNFTPPENSPDTSYWLTFMETYEKTKFMCMLRNIDGEYVCSAEKTEPQPGPSFDTFMDMDVFEISLCHNESNGLEICEVLDDEYKPVENIKPNPPCCLTVTHNSSQHHFTWISTYEEYAPSTDFVGSIQYQLHYYKRGDEHNVLSHAINTNSLNYSVDDEHFVPDTEYAARVRSSPEMSYYSGEWSDWSAEVYWRIHPDPALTAQTDFPSNILIAGLFGFATLTVIIFWSCALVKKWKQQAFIPTPAPYFHTLYHDYQGDFKSWVITHEIMAYMLKAEETLQIDTLTKCEVVEEEERQPQFHHQLIDTNTYRNISDGGCDSYLLGIPYAVSTMSPMSSPESSLSPSLSPQTGSPTEGDSGCWLETEPPWYCNEYCTLSSFQYGKPAAAEDHGTPSAKPYSTGE